MAPRLPLKDFIKSETGEERNGTPIYSIYNLRMSEAKVRSLKFYRRIETHSKNHTKNQIFQLHYYMREDK